MVLVVPGGSCQGRSRWCWGWGCLCSHEQLPSESPGIHNRLGAKFKGQVVILAACGFVQQCSSSLQLIATLELEAIREAVSSGIFYQESLDFLTLTTKATLSLNRWTHFIIRFSLWMLIETWTCYRSRKNYWCTCSYVHPYCHNHTCTWVILLSERNNVLAGNVVLLWTRGSD